jgi:preprotein translocase subunit YajC
MTAASGAFGLLVGAAPAKSSGSNPTIFILLLVGVAFYFLFYRPQQKKQKAARAATNTFDVGDEVVTAGGIVGRVLDVTGDRVTLETSVGASFVVLRPYVLRKLEPAEPPSDVVDGDTDDDADDEHDEERHPEPPAEPPPGADPTDAGESDAPTSPPPAEDPNGSDGPKTT